jgi:DNA-binding IclR family transcriptional regulator
MSQPAAETLEREKDKLYVTDAELIRRLGVPAPTVRRMLPELEAKFGFPRKSRLFDRRYWPEVKAWLDKHHGLNPQGGGL